MHQQEAVATPVTPQSGSELLQSRAQLFVRIAGTMAHDLNNTLMVIGSYCELLLDRMPAADPRQTYVQRIQNASRKAAQITGTMFAFARPISTPPEALDLDAVLFAMAPALQSIVGKQRIVNYSAGAGRKTVRLANSHMTQVIVATVVAVSEGMPATGSVDIHTGLLRWDRAMAESSAALPSGDYVWISMAASQPGSSLLSPDGAIDCEALERSLTSVQELVTQCGGQIAVHTGEGMPPTITIYLPQFDSPDESVRGQAGGGVTHPDSMRLAAPHR